MSNYVNKLGYPVGILLLFTWMVLSPVVALSHIIGISLAVLIICPKEPEDPE